MEQREYRLWSRSSDGSISLKTNAKDGPRLPHNRRINFPLIAFDLLLFVEQESKSRLPFTGHYSKSILLNRQLFFLIIILIMPVEVKEGQAQVVLVGCGAPNRGMGWYHAEQMLRGDIPSAALSYIVEPWFLGAGT